MLCVVLAWLVPLFGFFFCSRINSARFLQNHWAYNIGVRRPREYKLWPDNPETVSSLEGNSFLFLNLFTVPENKKTSNPTVSF